MNTLKQLLQEVNTIGFWGRIFGWNRIKQLLAAATGEFDVLVDRAGRFESDITNIKSDLVSYKAELKSKEARVLELEKAKTANDAELAHLRSEVSRLSQENLVLKNQESQRVKEHAQTISSLKAFQEKVQRDQDASVAAEHQKEIDRLEKMKATWSKHQAVTKERIKAICQRHTIEYVDKVSFKGDPDNTVTICGEYIVFDAKSPASDDLSNFANYLKGQAEKAVKYSKQENVKKDIYFVVPSNTIEHLTQFVYPHADHDVYIIAADALEPLLLNLQKIEEYEFAEELTPEQRSNICRIIGRFAHLAKRRVQVDNYFATQTIELAYACENYLPEDIMEQVKEYERAEKLNPPQEKRTKSIPVDDLKKETSKVQREAEGRGVLIDPGQVSENMNEVPLYKE
jgi:hypothetical protein